MRLIAVAAAALVLAGCSAPAPTVEPSATSAPSAEIAKPSDAARAPAAACNTPELGEVGAWISADGAWYEAGLVGEGSTVAILLHQSGSNYCGWSRFIEVLGDNGIRSMVINLCGSGATKCGLEDHPVASGANAVLAAAEYAREDGATRVVVVGASMGGTTAMVAAGSDTEGLLDAAADLSGPIEFSGIFASDYAANVTVPLFFAVSENDMAVTADELENLGGQTASEQISVAPGIGHGWDMLFEGNGAQSALATSLVEFIAG